MTHDISLYAYLKFQWKPLLFRIDYIVFSNNSIIYAFKLFLSSMVDLLFFYVKMNLNLSMSWYVTNTVNRVRSMKINVKNMTRTMMGEHLTKDMRQHENNKKPILDDTKIRNLGNDESVEETHVNVH